MGGLALNTRAEVLRAVTPGNSATSLLLQRVTGEKPPRMPLNGPPLTEEQIAILRAWIDEGALGDASAPAAERWQPPLAPRMPPVPAGASHPVDAFLNTGNAPQVEDAVFARRVYLDLWGLLPTPGQLRDFQKKPAREKLIARLLDDEVRYAGHWISFWNDLLRNDEGVIYYGERKPVTAWLRKALEENLPYDRFVAELLNPPAKNGPEGFILGVTWRGEVPASERPPLQAAQNSAQTFLGINLKCNSCHDSFISNWKLKDAYGLASFFSPEPLEIVRCDAKTGETSQPKFLFPELGPVAAGGTLEERRAEAARLFTMKENGRLARTLVNRYWKQLFGRGLVEPVDDMAARPSHPELLDWLAADFAAHRYDVKRLLRTILTSRAYQMPSIADAPSATFRGPMRRRLTAEQYADAIAALTGDWRFRPAASAAPTRYVRDWELKSTALSRALGRPVRDQVVTERRTLPTTLQAVELVNGQYLAGWLHEAARRMVDAAPPPPANLFDSGVVRRNPVKVDVKLKGARKLWFLIENVDSYDPSRVVPMWKDAAFVKGKKSVPLRELIGQDPENLRLPARFTVDLAGRKFDRFTATAQVTKKTTVSDIGPAIRYFVFDREPDMRQLVRVSGKPPVPVARRGPATAALIEELYLHALQRPPAEAERGVAREVIGAPPTADGLEDFLWMLLQSPEFQYIR